MRAFRDGPGARPGKRAVLDAADRREQLLEAALAVIARQGFHQTSMADIAARAGVSRATLYLHFQDRRDILVALADRIARRVIAAVDAWPPLPEPAPPSPEGGVAEMEHLVPIVHARIVQVLTTIFDNADAAGLVLRVTRGNDSLVDDTLRRIDDRVAAALQRDFETAIAHGWIRPCNAAVVAGFVLGGIERLTMRALDRDEPLDIPALAGELTAVLAVGLVNPARFTAAATEGARTAR